jgi:predicted nuclease of predicted toxin-antitoxin system
MKFLANMGISPDTVKFLRDLGYEAVHLHEEGLDRLPDPDILCKARREGYVLLTSDLDFGELLAHGGEALPSVVIFRLSNMHPVSVNRHLAEVIERFGPDLERGVIASMTERRIRVRQLPIEKRRESL